MAVVYVKPPRSIKSDWNRKTHNGYPLGRSRMVSLVYTEKQVERGKKTITKMVTEPALTYVFPFTPVDVEVGRVGLEYVEIDRPNNFKLLDVRGPQLLQASFNFVVVHRPSGGLKSIDDDLRFLMKMAKRPAPVAFAGLGDLLGKSDKTFRLWRITDLSYTITRRDRDGKATRADVSISLTEDRTPRLEITTLPRISYQAVPQTYQVKSKTNKPKTPAPPPALGWSKVVDP